MEKIRIFCEEKSCSADEMFFKWRLTAYSNNCNYFTHQDEG